MTVWNYGISWDKFSSASRCLKQLQYKLDKTPYSDTGPNFYMQLGQVSQFIFEQYFNQQVNLKAGGTDQSTITRVVDRLLASDNVKSRQITYPMGKDFNDLITEVRSDTIAGFQLFREMDLLKRPCQSEVKWNSVFRGMRLFAMIDFMFEIPGGYVMVDGKGHKEKNAEKKQVQYYALNVMQGGSQIKRAGLAYWKHGWDEIDVTPEGMREFIDTTVNPVMPIFNKLKAGTKDFPTNPSKETCKFCNWRSRCDDSPYRRPTVDTTRPSDEVSL